MHGQLAMPFSREAQARSRHRDPETSHEAARQHEASGVAAERRRKIAAALKRLGKPATPAEIAELTGIDYFEVHRRLSECDSLNLATYVRDPSDPTGIKGRKVRCPIRQTVTRLWVATKTAKHATSAASVVRMAIREKAGRDGVRVSLDDAAEREERS